MNDLTSLLAQREQIDAQIRELQKSKKAEAIVMARKLISDFDLQRAQIFGGNGGLKRKVGVVEAKYRDPNTGRTWSGRGKPPSWIKDQDRTKFMI